MNMFAYCNNSVANNNDSGGAFPADPFSDELLKYGGAIVSALLTDKIIHDRVTVYLVNTNPGVKNNRMVKYPTGGFGFVDLYNPNSGEIWELKKYTVSGKRAQNQLNKYVTGRLNQYENLTLSVSTTPLRTGRFVTQIGFDVYKVCCYMDPDVSGLVRYQYTKVNSLGDLVQSVLNNSYDLMPELFPFPLPLPFPV